MLPLLLARPGPSSSLAFAKRTFSTSLPTQSRIRPSRQPSWHAPTPSAPTPSTSTSSSSSSSPPSVQRYTLGGLSKASTPFSFSTGPTSIASGQASFSTSVDGGFEGASSSTGGGLFDVLSGPAADRRSSAILRAQESLTDLLSSSTTTSPSTTILDDPSFPLSDPLLLPFPRPNTSSASLLVPFDAPSSSEYSYALPPLDLSSAWFPRGHASHAGKGEPSLAEQHARIEASRGGEAKLESVEREMDREEEEKRLEMEMFRMMAVTRLEVEEDRGWAREREEGRWIGEEETEGGEREVNMDSVLRKRKKMMAKHKYKKRRKAQATMRKRQKGK